MASEWHDPSDEYDTDAVLWAEDREIARIEATRLLTDGRAVRPMTVADMMAEKAAAMRDPRNDEVAA